MLNKGLHSEEARSGKREAGSTKTEVGRLKLTAQSYSDPLCISPQGGKAHSSQLAAQGLCNPQNEFAYSKNQTKTKKELIAIRKHLPGEFLPLVKGEYPDVDSREEGVIFDLSVLEEMKPNLLQDVPTLTQKPFRSLGRKKVKPSCDGTSREGVNPFPTHATLKRLSTSSFSEEGTSKKISYKNQKTRPRKPSLSGEKKRSNEKQHTRKPVATDAHRNGYKPLLTDQRNIAGITEISQSDDGGKTRRERRPEITN